MPRLALAALLGFASAVSAPAQQTIQVPVPASTVDATVELKNLPAGCTVTWSAVGAAITGTVSGCAAPTTCPAGFTCTPVTPPPPPPPPPPNGTLAIGAKVQTKNVTNVRATPGAATPLGTQNTGATGTITDGPQTANGFAWWNVKFTSGVSGWVGFDNLAVIGGTPPPPPPPPTACGSKGCAAFPGAEGGGAQSAGGRGGRVIEVTNLNDSGTGSFRGCVEAMGPRTCKFKVAGVIHPKSRIEPTSPFLTIAGQTAPGGGITLQGDLIGGDSPTLLFIATHDVVVRYLTCRIGLGAGHSSGPSTGASCWELGSATVFNVVLDHLSASWWDNKGYITACNDACNGIHDNTVQWNLDAEPNVAHPVGPMTDATIGGPAANGVNNDFHHNMYAEIDHRIPLFNVKSGRWENNLVWNPGSMGANFLGLWQGGSTPDIIGNKVVNGNLSSSAIHEYQFNSAQSGDSTIHDMPGPPAIYMRNNINAHNSSVTNVANDAGQKAATLQGSEGGGNGGGAVPASWFRASPLPAVAFPITENDPNTLDNVLLWTVGNSQGIDCDGKWFNRRDKVDTRIIDAYNARSSGSFFSVVDANHSVPAISGGTPCVETLHDGIPDQWKKAKGLSVTDASLHQKTAPNGYTWLENYLNGQ